MKLFNWSVQYKIIPALLHIDENDRTEYGNDYHFFFVIYNFRNTMELTYLICNYHCTYSKPLSLSLITGSLPLTLITYYVFII